MTFRVTSTSGMNPSLANYCFNLGFQDCGQGQCTGPCGVPTFSRVTISYTAETECQVPADCGSPPTCKFWTCEQQMCIANDSSPGTACGSSSDTDCNNPDACDASGICQPNYEPLDTACGNPIPTECDDPDTCNATGICLPNYESVGTTCGIPNDTECDNPDACDGLGACLDDFESTGTSCTSNGDLCTDDECDGLGFCTHPDAASGTLCESDGDPCTDDECDGFGVCIHPGAPDETPCTSDGNDCTIDVCFQGVCSNFDHFDGTPCDDGDVCTSPDECSGGVCVGIQDCPFVVHGAKNVSFEDHAFGGYIDPRAESDNGVDFNLGLDHVTIVFSEQVRNIGGGALTAAAFSVAETGSGTGTQRVRSISTTDDVTVTVHLDRIITLWEWTTIVAAVEDLAGNPIESFGDMGAKANEPDRMDFGFLPADVNQDGNINPLDLLRFKQIINGDPPTSGIDVDFLDINRNGSVNPLDLIAFKQLINGISPPATQSWSFETMNNTRP